MGVVLDTNVLIDLLLGDAVTARRLEDLEARGLQPTLSSVVLFEALSGIEFTRSRTERSRLESLLRRFPIEPFDADSARSAAELRAELLRVGRSPGAPDVMIAGQAIARGHTLVTRDRELASSARALGASVVAW